MRNRKVLSLEWKNDGVMDDKSGGLYKADINGIHTNSDYENSIEIRNLFVTFEL